MVRRCRRRSALAVIIASVRSGGVPGFTTVCSLTAGAYERLLDDHRQLGGA
jgi:hypothetical protein